MDLRCIYQFEMREFKVDKMPFLINQTERNTNLLYIKIESTWVFYFPDW